MVIEILNDSLTYEDLLGFLDFYSFTGWESRILKDLSEFSLEESDSKATIVMDGDGLSQKELKEFVEFLTSWMTIGTRVTLNAGEYIIKGHKGFDTEVQIIE